MKKQILLTLSSFFLVSSINARPGVNFDRFIEKRTFEKVKPSKYVARMQALATALYATSILFLQPTEEEWSSKGGKQMLLVSAITAALKSLTYTLNQKFDGLRNAIEEVKAEAAEVADKEGDKGALNFLNTRYQGVLKLIPEAQRTLYGATAEGDLRATLPNQIS